MNIESTTDSYPLSPMQQGMLFHSLTDGEPGVDIEQVICTLNEPLDVPMFAEAWQQVVNRHAILKSQFRWTGAAGPCQEVQQKVTVPVSLLDWRDLPPLEQRATYETWLKTDRERGFELTQAPLIRISIFRISEHVTRVVSTFHHLLLDGRALVIVLREVFSSYEARCAGETVELAPAPPYRDYIDWLPQADLTGAEQFWRKQLEGFNTPTPLVVARSAGDLPASNRHTGEQQVELDAVLTRTLRDVARKHHVTLNTIVQGAWALVLSRYSGNDDVVFGAVRACRHAGVPGAHAIVGLLINTVPVRVRLPAEALLFDWLASMRSDWRAMRDFENAPLVSIQGWSELERGQPLFETIVNFQEPSWDAALRALGGRWRERQFDIRSQTNYPLVLDAYGGETLLLKILYHCRRFEDATIERMLGHLKTVLESMATSPGQKLHEVPLMTETELQQVLVAWNDTRAAYSVDRCVHQLVEEQAKRAPDALAVSDGAVKLTYRELNQRAEHLANLLRSRGVAPDTCVAVHVKRSAEMVVALLGVWKAGGAYVPLDPEYPLERLEFMLEDAQPPVVLTHSSLRGKLKPKAPSLKVICVDEAVLSAPAHGSSSAHTSHNLAYVIYTSGSTGRPKGVEIEHRSLMNLITWHQRTYKVTAADRATQLAAPGFDASVWEIWPYLTAGASVHIPDEETRLSPTALAAWLSREKISLTFVPTPLAEALLELDWPEECMLRAVLTGGDRLRRTPGPNFPCALVNHYGPTENTVVSTWSPVSHLPHRGGIPPIGRPLTNTQVFVLDRNLRPVPVGVPGELHVGGASLARGYHRRPELTAGKFISNPFSRDPGSRLYKTGDLVRWLPDGNLEFIGRLDNQVKVRGVRIELGEIESVLGGHPKLRRALVVAREQLPGGNQLTAYAVTANGHGPSPDELRAFLKSKLPAAMVPAEIVLLDELPVTPNGKIDYAALPVPDQKMTDEEFVAPRTDAEEKIARIWSQILGGKRIGIHDDFFELGGHSLSATQVVARLHSEFHIQLPVRALFDHPTVAGLAEAVAAANKPASAGERHKRPAAPRNQTLAEAGRC